MVSFKLLLPLVVSISEAAIIRYMVFYWHSRQPAVASNYIHDAQAHTVVERMREWSGGRYSASWSQGENTVRVINEQRASNEEEARAVLQDMSTLVYNRL